VTLLQALVLGLVEGVTEYLPVSSTGHLLLAERALGLVHDEAADAYAICIQAGAILAVLGLYRMRVGQMVRGVLGGDADGRRLLVNLVVAFVPAAVLGLAFSHAIKDHLFGLWPVVAAWTAGGIAIFAFRDRFHATPKLGTGIRRLEDLRPGAAVMIGLAQCLALWPGTSRSLATILGAVLLGVSLPAAVEFSFLLGLITLGAATAHDALKHGHAMVTEFGVAQIVLGTMAAAVSAALSVKWLVGWLQTHGLGVFAVWRIGLAAAVAGLLVAGVIQAG
jgi:undecaprenyl-diphosphatase